MGLTVGWLCAALLHWQRGHWSMSVGLSYLGCIPNVALHFAFREDIEIKPTIASWCASHDLIHVRAPVQVATLCLVNLPGYGVDAFPALTRPS
jgi:hypothetical protein